MSKPHTRGSFWAHNKATSAHAKAASPHGGMADDKDDASSLRLLNGGDVEAQRLLSPGGGLKATESNGALTALGGASSEKHHHQPQSTTAKAGVLYTVGVFAFYIVAGPSTIFLNSYLLNEVHFPYAATLSLLGVAMSCVVAWLLIAVGVVPSKQIEQVTPKFYLLRVVPIGLSLAFTLAFGNAVYLYLSVAFIQILKAFSPVILVCLLFATRLEKPRSLLSASIAVIVSGVVTATRGELNATPRGILVMLASESFEAVKVVNMQILLTTNKYDAWESLAVFGPAAIAGLVAVAYVTEDLAAARDVVLAHPGLFFAASLGGLAVNLATSLYIKATSALTLRVTSLGRNVGIVLVSAAIFPDSTITSLEFLGYLLSLVGCLIYQHARTHVDETIASLWGKLKLRWARTSQLLLRTPAREHHAPEVVVSTASSSSSSSSSSDAAGSDAAAPDGSAAGPAAPGSASS